MQQYSSSIVWVDLCWEDSLPGAGRGIVVLAERCWHGVDHITQQLLKPSQPVSDLPELSIEERTLHEMTSSWRKLVWPGYRLALTKLTCHSPVLGSPGNCVHLDGVTELFSHHEADRGTEMIVRVNPVPGKTAQWSPSLLTWWGTSPGREGPTLSLQSCTSRTQSAPHSQGSPWLCHWPSWRCSPRSWLFPRLQQSWRRRRAPPGAAGASPPPLVPPCQAWSDPGPRLRGRGWWMFSCWLTVRFCWLLFCSNTGTANWTFLLPGRIIINTHPPHGKF